MAARPLRLHFLALACFLALLVFVGSCFANKKTPPAHPINLNTATSGELQQIPGIGPVTAEKILKMRKLRGPFRSVNELRAIKGIGPKRFAKMKPYLTINSEPPQKKAAKRASRAPSSPN